MIRTWTLILFYSIVHFNLIADNTPPPSEDELYQLALDQIFKIKDHHLPNDSILAISNLVYNESLTREDDFKAMQSRILSSWYYYEKWKTDTVKSLTDQNIAYFNSHKKHLMSVDHGRTLYILSKLYLGLHEYPLAKSTALEASRIFQSSNENLLTYYSLLVLGTIESRTANNTEALSYYLKAYTINTEYQLPSESLKWVLHNISITYGRMGENEKKMKYSFLALNLLDGSADEDLKTIILNSLGNSYSEKGDLDSALFYFEEAKKLARKNNNINRYYLAECAIMVMYSNQKNLENIKLSMGLGRSILQDKESVPLWVIDETKIIMSQNYLTVGMYDSCISLGRDVFFKAIEGEEKNDILDLSDNLWQAYEKKGLFDSAFFFLNIYQSTRDSIFNDINQKKFNHLYAQLETIEKQNEIDLLTEKNLVAELNRRLTAWILGSLLLFLFIGFAFYRHRQRLKNREMQRQLELNQNKLTNYMLNMINKNNGFSEIEEAVKSMKQTGILSPQKVLNIINLNKSENKDWENFSEYFSNVHPEFSQKLSAKYSNLSANEHRLAALIKMNLSNFEIASILNIEQKSIRMAKYRLKKKLEIPEDSQLYQFLLKL